MCVSDYGLAKLCRRSPRMCMDGLTLHGPWVSYGHTKHFPSFIFSLSVSPVCLSLSLAHFPNQVLKRNIKHFHSTIPPLLNRGSVCVHGVYDPKPFEVLIFPCVSQCLRPPTVQQPHNAPFSCHLSLG